VRNDSNQNQNSGKDPYLSLLGTIFDVVYVGDHGSGDDRSVAASGGYESDMDL
jgi:hypothetical protein